MWGGLGHGRRVLRRSQTVRAASAIRIGRRLQVLLAGTHSPPPNVFGVSWVALESVLEHFVIRESHLEVGLRKCELRLQIRLRLVCFLEL